MSNESEGLVDTKRGTWEHIGVPIDSMIPAFNQCFLNHSSKSPYTHTHISKQIMQFVMRKMKNQIPLKQFPLPRTVRN